MNNNPIWNQIKGNWQQVSGTVKQQWGQLTNDDVTEAAGDRDKLAGKIQQRYGLTQQKANEQIDAWAEKLKF